MRKKWMVAIAGLSILLMTLTGCGSSKGSSSTAVKSSLQSGKSKQVPTGLLYPVTVDHKIGLINSKGQMVVQPTFDDKSIPASEYKYSEGLMNVWQNNKWGYIDTKGKMVISPQFASAKPFSEGLAAAAPGTDGYGYINKQGKIVIKPQFYTAEPFSEGYAVVRTWPEQEWGIIDRIGKITLQPENGEVNGLSPIGPVKQGLASIYAKNKKYGFIDTSGKMVIPAKYNKVSDFSDGLAFASNDNGAGYIDRTGKMVIELPQLEKDYYYTNWPFSEGMAPVRNSYGNQLSHGYVDTSGKMVIKTNFSAVSGFKYGLAVVGDPKSPRRGVIDMNGKLVIPCKYFDIDNDYGELLRAYRSENRTDFVWLDRSGKVIWRNKTID